MTAYQPKVRLKPHQMLIFGKCGHKRKRGRLTKPMPQINNSQFALSNRFSVLESQNNGDSNAMNISTPAEKITRPPPIFVHGVMDYTGMRNVLMAVAETKQYTTKSLANNLVKIRNIHQYIRNIQKNN